MELSYWEKNSFLNYDFIVLGAGIVGLSTAINLREKEPKKSVLVLERGAWSSGASTRNAGFACVGSLTEILADFESMSASEVIDLVQLRMQGLQILRNRLGDEAMGYKENGSHELITEAEEYCLEKIDFVNELLAPILPKIAFKKVTYPNAQFPFGGAVKHLISNENEGEIDTGKMMQALLQKAQMAGVVILVNSPVIELEELVNHIQVTVQSQFPASQITFYCQKLIVCTNAFTKKFFPEIDLNPGRGQVLITHPVSTELPKGIFHFQQGYYYFRNVENRILLGGGRNLDFEKETSTDFESNQKIQQDLVMQLNTLISPSQKLTVDYFWQGIMAFGQKKTPLIQAYSKRVFLAVRMGGMGVAIGSAVAEKVVDLVLKE